MPCDDGKRVLLRPSQQLERQPPPRPTDSRKLPRRQTACNHRDDSARAATDHRTGAAAGLSSSARSEEFHVVAIDAGAPTAGPRDKARSICDGWGLHKSKRLHLGGDRQASCHAARGDPWNGRPWAATRRPGRSSDFSTSWPTSTALLPVAPVVRSRCDEGICARKSRTRVQMA